MSPSRGGVSHTHSHKSTSSSPSTPATHDEHAVQQQSNSAYANARRNFNYLINPATAGAATKPAFRTRALLRTVRYVAQFIIWRVVRYAKYAAVGALTAAVGATVFGSVVSGVAWIAAPPTIGTGILSAVIWGVGKFAAKRFNKRWHASGGDAGTIAREKAEDAADPALERDRLYVGPAAVAW